MQQHKLACAPPNRRSDSGYCSSRYTNNVHIYSDPDLHHSGCSTFGIFWKHRRCCAAAEPRNGPDLAPPTRLEYQPATRMSSHDHAYDVITHLAYDHVDNDEQLKPSVKQWQWWNPKRRVPRLAQKSKDWFWWHTTASHYIFLQPTVFRKTVWTMLQVVHRTPDW